MYRGGTLQSAECYPCTLVAACLSDSLRNFTPVLRRVSPQDFLPILGAPQRKITNRSFWPACNQERPQKSVINGALSVNVDYNGQQSHLCFCSLQLILFNFSHLRYYKFSFKMLRNFLNQNLRSPVVFRRSDTKISAIAKDSKFLVYYFR